MVSLSSSDAAAQFTLAYKYENGLGVTLNYVEAQKRPSIAAANGDTEAATFQDTLERKDMTAAQFAEAASRRFAAAFGIETLFRQW